MNSVKMLVAGVLGTLVLVFGVAFLFSKQSSDAENVAQVQLDPSLVAGDARHAKLSGDGATEASEAATLVQIVEFSDFECPACQGVQPLLSQVMASFPGQIELVYRHFPLQTIHPLAFDAAVLSELAAEAGVFWEFHDQVFENQETWTKASDPRSELQGYLVSLGVDQAQVSEALGRSDLKTLVQTDLDLALSLGLRGTPSFFVDGVAVEAVDLASAVAAKLQQ